MRSRLDSSLWRRVNSHPRPPRWTTWLNCYLTIKTTFKNWLKFRGLCLWMRLNYVLLITLDSSLWMRSLMLRVFRTKSSLQSLPQCWRVIMMLNRCKRGYLHGCAKMRIQTSQSAASKRSTTWLSFYNVTRLKCEKTGMLPIAWTTFFTCERRTRVRRVGCPQNQT